MTDPDERDEDEPEVIRAIEPETEPNHPLRAQDVEALIAKEIG